MITKEKIKKWLEAIKPGLEAIESWDKECRSDDCSRCKLYNEHGVCVLQALHYPSDLREDVERLEWALERLEEAGC
jgi:hypothetical protein